MELNKYMDALVKDAIANAAIIKRVKGVVQSVTNNSIVVKINSPLPLADKNVEIANTTRMTAVAGDVVWVYYWKNIASGFILPANLKGVGEFYNGKQGVEIFGDYSGTNTINAVGSLNNVTLSGTKQQITQTGYDWESIQSLLMWGDTNTVNIAGGIIQAAIIGAQNTVSGKMSNTFVFGYNNRLNSANGYSQDVVFGNGNIVGYADNCSIVGWDNNVQGTILQSAKAVSVFGTGADCDGAYPEYGACALGANPTLTGATTALAVGMSSPLANHNGMILTTTGDLNVYGTVNSNVGADYAEYEEWQDGNANNEDRRGRFVMETGEFIRLANSEDDVEDILGIVSASPTICGDAHGMDWKGRFEKDVFGGLIYKDQEFTDQEDNTHTIKAEVETAEYDDTLEYVARSDRKEFSPIAYMGKVIAVDDGTCEVDGYCKPSDNGIATKSDTRTRFRVRKRIDSTHILVRIR